MMPWSPVPEPKEGPFHETWFLKVNDPDSGDALWLRYVRRRAAERSASCWWLLFERAAGKVRAGRWERPYEDWRPGLFRLGDCVLEDGLSSGRGEGASWELRWRAEPIPAFDFVPPGLGRWTGSAYVAAAPYARFTGRAVLGGRELRFKDAPGSIGRLWGRSMARRWRWGQACLRAADGSPAAFELLSVRLPLPGGLESPWLTAAHLHYRGRHHQARGLGDLLRSGSRLDGRRWTFSVAFPGLRARGCFEQPEAPVAKVLYRDLDGSRLCCRNSKTARLELELAGRGREPERLASPDAAAFELVDRELPPDSELDLR